MSCYNLYKKLILLYQFFFHCINQFKPMWVEPWDSRVLWLCPVLYDCTVHDCTNPILPYKSQHQRGAVFWMAVQHISCTQWGQHVGLDGAFLDGDENEKLKACFFKTQQVLGWKVLLKHSWSSAVCWPNLIWPCFHNPSVQTDKTAQAPFLQLVCLESLQRLGANDLQTDSPAGFACPAALCFLFVLHYSVVNV